MHPSSGPVHPGPSSMPLRMDASVLQASALAGRHSCRLPGLTMSPVSLGGTVGLWPWLGLAQLSPPPKALSQGSRHAAYAAALHRGIDYIDCVGWQRCSGNAVTPSCAAPFGSLPHPPLPQTLQTLPLPVPLAWCMVPSHSAPPPPPLPPFQRPSQHCLVHDAPGSICTIWIGTVPRTRPSGGGGMETVFVVYTYERVVRGSTYVY